MQKLLIKGKKKISGSISISGSKNATLPILAASLLANNIKLTNVPFVKDISTMLELLRFIGTTVKIMRDKNNFSDVDLLVKKLDTYAADSNYVNTIRSVIEKNNFKLFDNKTISY